ncbi:CKLF-like MARVEL transmembrane domain-containing protein 8b [Neoarius graeffei]|uniref:CKLF-like MARVEL transmembrane domain-containing protein 8b n=1 Tax=Neoarius graeffei TaxID=443677 RepID=UPI00298CF80D|nr:CKLF-like MARVEL transmembrane domain-containing protein 8b [Neoarius graeffei]
MEEDPESRAVTTVNRSSKSPTLEDLGLSHSALAYDNKFVCSPPGMLMLGEIVCGLLVWTLLGGTDYLQVPALGWVMFVSVVCWVLTVCLLLLHLTTAHTKIPQVPWSTLGLCFNSSATILYMTAAVINSTSVPQAIRGRYYYISWIASTVFAFLVVLCYAANSYVSYKSWRSKSDDS